MNTVPDCPGFGEFGIAVPQYADTDDVVSNKNKGSVRRDILQVQVTLITILLDVFIFLSDATEYIQCIFHRVGQM